MKKITFLIAIFLLTSLTAMAKIDTAEANKKLLKTVTRKAQEIKSQKHKKGPICYACGKEITSNMQHCEALGHVALCSEVAPQNNAAATPDIDTCPKCGAELTIDERFHGKKHVCDTPKKNVCYRCGEEILDPHQHCSATNGVELCSTHKVDIKPQADSQDEVCPKCGAELTVDERFHGKEHVCDTPKKNVCYRCGEEILDPHQHCRASYGVELCSVNEEETKPQVDSQDVVCPKCGAKLTIDERFHGQEHHCK